MMLYALLIPRAGVGGGLSDYFLPSRASDVHPSRAACAPPARDAYASHRAITMRAPSTSACHPCDTRVHVGEVVGSPAEERHELRCDIAVSIRISFPWSVVARSVSFPSQVAYLYKRSRTIATPYASTRLLAFGTKPALVHVPITLCNFIRTSDSLTIRNGEVSSGNDRLVLRGNAWGRKMPNAKTNGGVRNQSSAREIRSPMRLGKGRCKERAAAIPGESQRF